MKALVVYESMWGNTEQIARAIADGLADGGEVEVDIVEVNQASLDPDHGVAIIVAGGPTHAFSMTRPSTRTDAVQKAAPHGSIETGLREWLEALPSGHHGPTVATFDTKIHKAKHFPGSAAKSASRSAHRHGYHTSESMSFYVEDIDGPLVAGELARALNWGRKLATSVVTSTTAERRS